MHVNLWLPPLLAKRLPTSAFHPQPHIIDNHTRSCVILTINHSCVHTQSSTLRVAYFDVVSPPPSVPSPTHLLRHTRLRFTLPHVCCSTYYNHIRSFVILITKRSFAFIRCRRQPPLSVASPVPHPLTHAHTASFRSAVCATRAASLLYFPQ